MTTKDLVLAIKSGKSADIQNSFDSIMNDKLVQVIGAYKEVVAEEVFGGEQVAEMQTEEQE